MSIRRHQKAGLVLAAVLLTTSSWAALPPGDRLDEAERLGNRGALLAQEGRYTEAIPVLRQALELNPRFVPGWYNLGLASERTDEHEKAAIAFEAVVGLLPDHADAWFHLGLARSRTGHHRDAAIALYQARELKPGDARPLIQLGYEAWHLDNWESAVDH